MSRRPAAATLLLAVLLVLAGCSRPPPGLKPGVVSVRAAGDGSYETTFWMESSAGDTLDGAVLHAFDMDGERVCTASFGTVGDDRVRETVRCLGFPAVLVPSLRGARRVDATDGSDLEHEVKGYVGYRNGSHRYETVTVRVANPDRFEAGPSLPPSPAVFEVVRCEQWRRGGDVSAVGPAPWMDRERKPPQSTTEFEVYVDNATGEVDPAETPVHGLDVLTPRLADHVRGVAAGYRGEGFQSISRSAFYRAFGHLANRNVSGPEEARAVGDVVYGRASTRNNRYVECRADPPSYDGRADIVVTVYVRHAGDYWEVQIRSIERFSGPAVANATAPPGGDRTATPGGNETATPTGEETATPADD